MVSNLKSILVVACVLAASLGLSAAGVNLSDGHNEVEQLKTQWTPIVMRPSVVPQAVQGSDGKCNLVYELLLTNAHKHSSTVSEVVVFDADTGKEVQRVSGSAALSKLLTVPPNAGGVQIAPGGTAIFWANLEFDNSADVPKRLVHEIVFDTKNMFDGKPLHYSYRGAPVEVNQRKPVVISSPLEGGKWIAIGGYCGVVGHRRTLLSVDNKQVSAQRYAIDWVRLDDNNFSTHGDRSANTSCSAYGQPIHAVADGTIVAVIDKFGEQKPFAPSGVDRFHYPAGNCIVEDIGEGLYGMYAHLKPGTIKVKSGDKVNRGDIIATLGNSGNSTGPHLHFHVVDGLSILGSNGVPYVFDKFNLVGELGDLKKFFENDSKGLPQSITDSKYKGAHENQLVKEGHIVDF